MNIDSAPLLIVAGNEFTDAAEPKNNLNDELTKSLIIWAGISAISRTTPILVRGTLNDAAYWNQIKFQGVLPFFAKTPQYKLFSKITHRPDLTMRFIRQNNLIFSPVFHEVPTTAL